MDNKSVDNKSVDNKPINNDITIKPVKEDTSKPENSDESIVNDKNMNKIIYYRNIILSFINNNKTDLVKIFLQHSRTAEEEDKIAVLGINLLDFETTRNVDVAYLPVRTLEPIIAEKITARIKENNINIIYFLMITPLEEQIIEIDIRSLIE
jgi:hypothetical protein